MRYRIMKIGDKFGAKIVKTIGVVDYIQRDGKELWSNAVLITKYCLCDTKEEAVLAGETYTKQINDLATAEEVLESAEEVA